MEMYHVQRAVAMCLGVLFLAAAFGKATNLRGFFEVLRKLRLATEPLSVLVLGVAIPLSEALIGAGLIVQFLWPVPAIAAMVAMLLFAGVVSAALFTGHASSCGCFGKEGRLSWAAAARNLGFAALCAALVAPDVLAGALFVIGTATVAASLVSTRSRSAITAESNAS